MSRKDIWKALRARRWRWVRRFAYSLSAVVCVWWIAVLSVEFPDALLEKSGAASLVVRDSQGGILRQEASSSGQRETWVGLGQISPHLIHATLASEDNDFQSHSGVDWSALARASWLNLKSGKVAYGGSTITMQLVRLLAETPRSTWGKLQQAVFAARLERKLSKDEILEQYLNRVYYGNGSWGAEQAARFYFGKSAAELSVGEASMLAVIPRGPSYYDPFRHWNRALKRRAHILGLMRSHGYLDKSAEELAGRTPLSVRRNRPDFRAPHFVEYAKDSLPNDFSGGAEVRTTLDYELQRRIETAVASHVDGLLGRNLTQAAVVVLRNSDGAILAMVGSRDYSDVERSGAFNGSTARLRPGSTLKPFVYGAAFENGDTPATLAYDVALPQDAQEFYTKDVKSHGFARYRESLAGSYNLSAVHTLQRVGITTVLGKLRAAGLWTLDKPDDEYDWGLAIGHAEVRLLDLTAAFSTFGRGGVPIVPHAIESVRHVDGRTFTPALKQRERVFSEEVSYQIFDILSDPDARKPMFGDRVPMNLPFKVALKTGTTKAYTDLWALGTTAEFTVGVWGGNFDGTPTHQVMSLQGATPLMRASYAAIAARYGAPTSPERPRALVTGTVCPLSGKLLGPYCQHHKNELFVTGQVPTETCDWHKLVCGEPSVVFPAQIRPWADFYRLTQTPSCEVVQNATPPRIVAPADGAHFLLEPHRAPQNQRPPLAAIPYQAGAQWFINDTPASEWIPTTGTHTVRVALGDYSDEISISYE